MREFNQTIDEKYFNLLWRALYDREAELSHEIENDPESDCAALLSNDLVYLRLCMDELKAKAEAANFSDSAFCVDDGFMDLRDL